MNKYSKLFSMCLLFILSFCLPLQATDKQYTIKNVSIETFLLDNGDANVLETWTIDFTKGHFSRFYVDKLIPINELESYSSIAFHFFSIDNVTCTQATTPSLRTPNTYSASKDSNYFTYEWYTDAENEEKTFQVCYTLQDIVKYTDSDKALFSHRFIGENFSHSIDQLDITIQAPSNCEINIKEGKHYVTDQSSNSISFSKSNTTGLVNLYITMPKNVFNDDLIYISEKQSTINWQTSSNTHKFSSSDILAFLTNCFILFIFLFILYSNLSRSMSRSLIPPLITPKMSRLIKDPVYINKLSKKFINEQIHPYEFYRLIHHTFSGMKAFQLIFFVLLEHKVIAINEDGVTLHLSDANQLKPYEHKLITILLDTLSFKKADPLAASSSSPNDQDNVYHISLSQFLSSFIASYKIIKLRSNQLCFQGPLSSNTLNLKSEAKILKNYLLYSKNTPYSKNVSDVFWYYHYNQRLDFMQLYYLAVHKEYTSVRYRPQASSSLIKSELTLSDFLGELTILFNSSVQIYRPNLVVHFGTNDPNDKGSSGGKGCSSCSSCSSCGGCGGGGAD